MFFADGTHRVDVPYPNGVIIGRCGKVHAVRRPRNVRQALCMPGQITDELPGEGGPNLGDVIISFIEYRASVIIPVVSLHQQVGGKGTIPQDASNVPSGLNLTEDIDIVCPRSVCLSS